MSAFGSPVAAAAVMTKFTVPIRVLSLMRTINLGIGT